MQLQEQPGTIGVRRLLGGLTLASLLALVSACSSGGSTDPAAVAAATAGSPGVVLNLGDQQQDLETLLQSSGALAGASYKGNFIEFDSGPLVDAGFAAHRIDVGFMGDLPASLAAKSKIREGRSPHRERLAAAASAAVRIR